MSKEKRNKPTSEWAMDFADWLWEEPQFTEWTSGKKDTEELYREFLNHVHDGQ